MSIDFSPHASKSRHENEGDIELDFLSPPLSPRVFTPIATAQGLSRPAGFGSPASEVAEIKSNTSVRTLIRKPVLNSPSNSNVRTPPIFLAEDVPRSF